MTNDFSEFKKSEKLLILKQTLLKQAPFYKFLLLYQNNLNF